MYQKHYHIHFVGIGGIGMSGIAELLLSLGYRITGSDLKSGPITERLKKLGAVIYQGHKKEQIGNADVIVTSTAISRDNAEVAAAEELSIPIIPRAEMLAELMRIKYAIAVSGAHGKTSTTAMTANVLNSGGLDPTIVIGGVLKSLGTNAIHGKGDYIVVEADESDGSFLKYAPAIAIVTNIDREHLDFYSGIEDIKANFIKFINSVPFYGLAILCLDNEYVQDILPMIKVRYTTFGQNAQAELQARQVSFKGTKSFFKVFFKGDFLGDIVLNLSGKHNVSNALAAVGAGLELNIPFGKIKTALEKIQGVKRRLEIKGEKNGVIVMDDYGHHPTEIKTTLEAVRASWPDKRLIVVFQPHRYSRTKALFDEFTRSFYNTDILIVLPIYAASEKKIENIDSKKLCAGIKEYGHRDVSFALDFDEALSMVSQNLKKGDLVLTLGAGDVVLIGERLVEIL